MQLSLTLDDIRQTLPDARITGERLTPLTGISSLKDAGPDDISFLGNSKYRKQVPQSRAGLILLPEDYEGEPLKSDEADAGLVYSQVYVRVKDPSLALAVICARVEQAQWPRPQPGIHPSAVIDPSAQIDGSASVGPLAVIGPEAVIGPGCIVEAQCHVGRGVVLGRDCWLRPHATFYPGSVLGERVMIHSGAVVGADGFGYLQIDNQHYKVPQIGKVVIENDVEIGANTTIDRARFGETRIGAGTKIDNLVQIAHNVMIGRCCIIVAQVGISGSTTIGNYVVFWGQAGTAGHIRIGDFASIGGQSGVNADVPAKARVRGTPAMPFMQAQRVEVLTRRLPELVKKVAKLEERLQE